MTARWTVHLMPEAETALRAGRRAERASLAEALDRLQREGPEACGIATDDGEWSGVLVVGDHLVTVAGRGGDARLAVLRIARPPRRRAADLLHGLALDFRYTLRALRRAPLFAAAVIGTLGVGLGGSTALLDAVHMVYRGPLPFGDGDRLVRIRNANRGQGRLFNVAARDFELLRDEGSAFSGVVAMGGRSLTLLGADGAPPVRVGAIGVSAGWARTLRLAPVLGRPFSDEEDAAGSGAAVALISHALWLDRFGGDPAVVGQPLRHADGVLTIVGVMPPGFTYPYESDVWTPWTFSVENGISSLNIVARLRDDATYESAQADADRVQGIRLERGGDRAADGFDVAPTRVDLIREDGRTLTALSAAVLLLFLLACVSVANLLIARFTTRRAELGLRAALGARRDQQLRQMLVESLLLFAGGAVASVLVSVWLRDAIGLVVPEVFRTELAMDQGRIGGSALAVAILLTVMGGLAVGAVAGARATRMDPIALLRLGGRGSGGRGDRRLFDALVVSQLSLSLVLLVAASLSITRFRQLSRVSPGYDVADVTTMRITLDGARYRDGAARLVLVRGLEERLATVPGVEGVGITTVNPLCCGNWGAPLEVEGRPVDPGSSPTLTAHSYVTPGFFEALRIPVLRGSGFGADEHPAMPLTVVVDERFARATWPGEDPIGKRVRSPRTGPEWRTVVGVVPDLVQENESPIAWYLPYLQDPVGPSTEQLHLMVRTRTAPVQALQAAILEVDRDLAVYGVGTMEGLWRERSSADRLGAVVSATFAAFGLLLAAFSLYSLLAYSVEMRRTEIGVRIALGASRREILLLVMRQAALRFGVGLALGLVVALGANQLLRGAIADLPWIGWESVAIVTGIMAGVGALAAFLPALKAAGTDPIRTLRG